MTEPAVPLCPKGLHPMTPENTYEWVKDGKVMKRVCRECRRGTDRYRYGQQTAAPGGLDELDLAILAVLPDEGSKLGKYLPDARTSNQIFKLLGDPYVNTNIIGRALSGLQKEGYAVSGSRAGTAGKKGGAGWQRTKKGKQATGADG